MNKLPAVSGFAAGSRSTAGLGSADLGIFVTASMAQRDVDLIAKTVVYDGYFKIVRYDIRYRLHDGGWSGPVRRELFERGHAAAVLPYDPERDEVVLIEQFRIGAFAADWHPWLIEIVAGIIDDGETAESVIRREAREEAGLEIGDIEPIADYLASPGGTSESVSVFCGRVDAADAGGIRGLDDEGEDIKVSTVSFDALDRMLSSGEIRNAVTIIALQWLLLHRGYVRDKWLGGS